MKKFTKIISLFLVVLTLFGFTACSNTPDYSVDEMIQKGYAMLDPGGDKTKTFTLTIHQGEKYVYTFSGRLANGSILSSLTVSRNGLKSNYKDLFLISGENLCINLNGAMSATESEIGFAWTDSSALQNRYLTISNGYTYAKDIYNDLKTNVFSDWATTRTGASPKDGDFDYNFKYDNANAKMLLSTIATKAGSYKENVSSKFDGYIKTLTATAFELYEQSLRYYQDKIDIDTEEVTGEYISTGTHFADLIKQEVDSLSAFVDAEGSYITEGVSYSEGDNPEFAHKIMFCDKNDKTFGSISLTITQKNADKIDATSYSYVTMEDFVGTMHTNIKNTKGVGYEKNDFPYIATYTANQLTLTETNDLYKSVHVFDFSGSGVSKYTVTFYTYNLKMHNALMNKYNGMKMKFITSSTDELKAGTGSGVLQYEVDSLGGDYSASDPIQLLALLEQIGVPTYGN